jgi:Protein of unknown function (DUF1553)/Protein of unknown function (DUF1549)/Planctomycete cytochrome C
MQNWTHLIRIILSALLLAVAVLSDSVAQAPPQKNSKIPRFESEILPIFHARCLTCHGESKQKGLDLRTRDLALKGGESGAAFVPGSARESLLFQKVASGAMPLGGEKLKDEEIRVIQAWIDEGGLTEGEDFQTAKKQLKAKQVTEQEIFVNVFQSKCITCHGKWMQEGGLDLRTRAGLLKGGRSGPGIIPWKPEESLVFKRLVADEMPPKKDVYGDTQYVRRVTADELEKLRHWIADGASETQKEVGGENEPVPQVSEADRKFWSFHPPNRPPVPEVRSQQGVRTPIDAFLLKKLEAKGLTFSPEAERLVLMRRAYFALTGIPPTPEEVEEYSRDTRPEAYERLIDRLLASPHFGERWGKYWLDAAGYADSHGKIDPDRVRPNAWRYRDYVIRSLNADKPYDQFLVEQIAGDELFDYQKAKELTSEQRDSLVATGFLRTAADDTDEGAQNFVPYRMAVLADQVNIFSSAVMGLTMECARCHSHKYDPIPQRDYYRFTAIFQAAYDPYDWRIPSAALYAGGKILDLPLKYQRALPYAPETECKETELHNAPVLETIKGLEASLESKAEPLKQRLFEERLAKLPESIRQDVKEAWATPEAKRSALQSYLIEQFGDSLRVELKDLKERFDDFKKDSANTERAIQEARAKLKPQPMLHALFDMGGEPTPTYTARRGDERNPGAQVLPGVPSVLEEGLSPYKVTKPSWSTHTSGRRLALARWLVQPNHPLTARVMVNRIWQHHFGNGLVATPGNFGKIGAAPTHPELLDWLATEFVRQKWSIKGIQRLIMSSSVYRQSSLLDAAAHGPDPDNVLLSRFPLRRLDAEAIRDSLLKVSGRLVSKPFGPPDELEITPDGEAISKTSKSGLRRSVYLMQRRSTPVTLLELFDAPRMAPNCLKRVQSTVPTQALQLWNSEMVRESSRYMAGRVIDTVGEEPDKQIKQIYLAALSRQPTAEEMKLGQEALAALTRYWTEHLQSEVPAEPRSTKARWLAVAAYCHIILNSPEFVYID